MLLEIITAAVSGLALLLLIILPIIITLRNGIFHNRCTSKRKLNGKTALVTGSSAGIGLETARDFASRGARVLLACRNLSKARAVADDITRTTGNKDIVIYKLDTSSLSSVRDCASKILIQEKRLDILINNAGMAGSNKRELTQDGLEATMAINYFGHFLLTYLLLDLILKTAPARIVNVSSELHSFCGSLDPENLTFKNKTCNLVNSYSQSKLCQVLFTKELARKIKGRGVTVNSLHPGFVATEIFGKVNNWITSYMGLVSRFVAKDSATGAQTTIHVAVSEDTENITGKYFDNCKVRPSSKPSEDAELAKRLWSASVRDVRLAPNEILY